MIYIACVLLSGFLSWIIAILFREKELRDTTVLLHRQFFLQIFWAFGCGYVFYKYFSNWHIEIGGFTLGWFSLYLIFSTVSFYMVQVFYEFFRGKKLFATEEEIENYIKKREEDGF